ncbi:MAG: DUF2604 domain-containing protein [Gammaproteobacteria bacterium]|nr:DUF2604 domain-containing protein [Gammaproteobacteria bacterium]
MREKLNQITIVVNGQPIKVQVKPETLIRTAVIDALKESGNSGQPLENWELRDSSGQIIDLDKSVENVVPKEGTELFLSLKAGVGGN